MSGPGLSCSEVSKSAIINHHLMFHCLDLSEDGRVEKAKGFVQKINKLSREKRQGGEMFHDLGVAHEDAGRNCPLCQLGGCCMGPNCLGSSGMLNTLSKRNDSNLYCCVAESKMTSSSTHPTLLIPSHKRVIPGLNTDSHSIDGKLR